MNLRSPLLVLLKKSHLALILKILFFTLLLSAGYYIFLLKPKLELPEKLLTVEKTLIIHQSILTQNRLAYAELTKLDPENASFTSDSTNLVQTLEATQKDGLKTLSEKNNIPEINSLTKSEFEELLNETETIYIGQEELMKEVLATEKYKDAISILKSKEGVNLLTRQTNLILKYQFWLEKIDKLL